jgi:hypothetical protein
MAALIGGVLFQVALSAAPAQATSYTVWSCRGPDGEPVSTAAWEPVASGAGTSDSCATGGSFNAHLLQSDDESGRMRGYRFMLPSGARISGYRVHLAAQTASALTPSAYQAGVDDDQPADMIDDGCTTSGCVFGTTENPLAAANLIEVDGTNYGRLRIGTVCGEALGCYVPAMTGLLAAVQIYRTSVDLRDDDAPELLQPAGLPAAGETVSGNPLVTFDASDGGGGVQTVSLLVDGNEVAHQDAGGACRQPYARPAPCPAQLSAALPLAVSTLAPGVHTAAIRATDAAGNIATGPPVSFIAAPPPPTVVERIVQVPGPTQQAVTIALDRDRLSLPAKGGRTISGAVKDAGGRPLAGATVIVRSRPFGVRRAKTKLEGTATTDAAGRFAIPPGKRSRLVILDVNDTAYRAVEPVEMSLMQRLTVGVLARQNRLRNGSTLTLRASVSGAGSGAGGKVVLVQALVEGRWTTVDSLSANADGRALWRYRFRATTRRISYRFRVKVERAGDVWPWPTTTSRVLRVSVVP